MFENKSKISNRVSGGKGIFTVKKVVSPESFSDFFVNGKGTNKIFLDYTRTNYEFSKCGGGTKFTNMIYVGIQIRERALCRQIKTWF